MNPTPLIRAAESKAAKAGRRALCLALGIVAASSLEAQESESAGPPLLISQGRWPLFVATDLLTDRRGRIRDGVLDEERLARLREKLHWNDGLSPDGRDRDGCGRYATPAERGFAISYAVGRSREISKGEVGLDPLPWQKRLPVTRLAVRGTVTRVIPGLDAVWYLPTNLVLMEVLRVYRNATNLQVEPGSVICFRTESGDILLEGLRLCVKSPGEYLPTLGDELIVRGEWEAASATRETPVSLLTRRDLFLVKNGQVRFPAEFDAVHDTVSVDEFERALNGQD